MDHHAVPEPEPIHLCITRACRKRERGIRLAAPLEQGLPTGLSIPGLDSVNVGLILVAVIVFGIAAGSFLRAVRRVRSPIPAEPRS